MKEFNPDSLSDLLQAKYLELKDSPIGKYFFLYFLHLLGSLTYHEKANLAIYTSGNNTFEVPLPIIDSKEQFVELERVHKNLERFFNSLKKKFGELSDRKLELITDLF